MLVAKRDPFHSGAHDVHDDLRVRSAAPGLARTMTMLQVLGSLLAIPVGIGSAYSLYRANFSVETTCQSLRSNIVSMLDRRVDAGTRHMLVRHDVESFEHTCGAVDPDATAAFKALLTAKLAVPPVKRVEVIPAVKTEPKQEAAVKPKAQPPVAAATPTEPAEHDAAVSDAAWIAAVREALVTGKDEPAPSAPAVPATIDAVIAQPAPPPAGRPVMREIRTSTEAPAQQAPLVLSPLALPPATPIASVPAPRQQADDHPVPPAPIPYAAMARENGGRSRLAQLVAQIPLVGRAIDAIDGKR
jgi:hypothetical protein